MVRTKCSSHRKEYFAKRRVRMAIIASMVVALVALEIYSLSVNNFRVSFMEAMEAVSNRINHVQPGTYVERMIDYVVVEVNGPRAVAAVLLGTVLAVCGAVMQSVTHNPLAEPYTIGISSAALFGVTISIALGVSIVPGLDRGAAGATNAFIFAMVPAVVIVLITTFRKLSPNMMILIGIGMMYAFSAVTTLIKFNADEDDLQEIYIWSLGTLSKIGWGDILPMASAAALVFVGFTYLAKTINLLVAGDNVCQSLGANPFFVRMLCFSMVSLAVAVAVCYSGTIGFVGLVAPHMTRLFTGNNNRLLIPVSAIAGSMLILIGDIVVRMLPGGLPAGVITALIGSPLFLYFLLQQSKQNTF